MNKEKEDKILPIDIYPDGVLIADTSSLKVIHINSQAREIFNVPPLETKKTFIDGLFRKNSRLIKALRDTNTEPDRKFFHTIRSENEGSRKLLIQIAREPHRKDQIALFIRDITSHHRLEKQLKVELKHHKNMASELHHRVKNNLSMVSSLISLKEIQLGSSEILTDLSCQVDAIQSVHEQLVCDNRVSKVKIRPYLNKIVRGTLQAFGCNSVQLAIDIPEILLPSKSATTLGLILNEITTNTCKHGAKKQPDKEISYSILMKKGTVNGIKGWYLMVENSGTPIPDNIDPANSGGLGMRLIYSMIQELQGTLRLTRAPHPQYEIWFPK